MSLTKVDRLLSILEKNVTLTKEQMKLIVREYKGKLSINELAKLYLMFLKEHYLNKKVRKCCEN
ncbi:hypothetical protein QLQ80_02750 [Mycoplasma sp. M5725]|uniref:Uncharacterized protein n=1 Tax=Mycoplasma phocimorsus TaxID=3045839 RepID=A0AAJ1UX45_9MOLU|nr:hypothetical protein [Mycoplasma phocimorsus]MDJ1645985.1 hypothetical protein [Mycoplasma phocimorsus]